MWGYFLSCSRPHSLPEPGALSPQAFSTSALSKWGPGDTASKGLNNVKARRSLTGIWEVRAGDMTFDGGNIQAGGPSFHP